MYLCENKNIKMIYTHTQTGFLMRRLLGAITVITGVSGIIIALRSTLRSIPLLASSVIILICTLLFDSLTVRVSQQFIQIHFGIGIIRKQFAIANIQNVTIVRNKWYYGWGLRLTPRGWLYNVAGLDAVEIRLHNGKQYRIGTDEPKELHNALNSVLA